MTSDTHLDGNALGGLLYDVFGREMTHRRGGCGTCGTVAPMAALLVYQGPGTVVRCSNCLSVVIVILTTPHDVRVIFDSLRWLDVAPAEHGAEMAPSV